MIGSKEAVSEIKDLLSKPVEPEKVEEVVEDVETEEEIEAGAAEPVVEDEVIADDDTPSKTPETYTIAELSEAIEWPVENLYNDVMIPLDDGQEPMKLGEMKNSYQNLTRDNATLKTQIEENKALVEQAQSGASQGQQISNEMMQAQADLQSLNRMEQGINWTEEEELDPTEALLKRDKFRRAREEVMENMNKVQVEQEKAQTIYLAQAQTKMVELIPTWSDNVKRDVDFSTILNHMATVGFSEAEAKSIVDPRTMVLLKELIDLRAEKSAASTALKKVKKAPTVLKGQGFKPQTKNDQTAALVKKAQKSGNKKDELEATKALLRSRV